jgi:hypothetical protein
MRNAKVNSQFAVGFISAFLLLAGVVLLSQAAAWFQMNPEFLNTRASRFMTLGQQRYRTDEFHRDYISFSED